ncbi:DUF1800 family protein [Pelomonas margarita]|uniref:DUF1800 family protein n=1 Tax=Pelomonas margarita TaxID=3299031 RepID=A0ABW7FQA0_9BURK
MFAQLLRRPSRTKLVLTLCTTLVLAACGGGGSSQEQAPAATPAAAEEPARRVIQSAASASEGAAPSLTIRAHANLAGDVGAMMSVRVDGVVTDSVEVRATQPTDYRLAIPALKPGSLVDVVYTNDGSVNGVDRNLHVQQISTADTAVLPTAAIVTYDKGPGAAAFDGQNVIAGITTVHSDGALRMAWPAPNLTDRLTVRASATPAGGVGAQMIVRVDGIVVGVSEVSSTEPVDHVFATPPIALNSRVDVALANAATVDGTARSLRVHYLMAGTTVMQPSAGNMFLDAGSGLAAYDGVTFAATSQNLLTANGALRGWWLAPNMTDSLTLRASARLLGNVGPIVKVLVDGVVIGTVELRSTTPADIALPSLPLKPGQRVEVVYTNPADGRALQLAYAITGKTVLLATNNTLNADWPEPNLTDSLLIRARGTPAGGVGPVMQVLVDGILVGSAEVKSTDNADFRFAVPPMTAGRKLDIAYVNDATVDGVDRNLFIAYATTANTVWLPGNAGNTYDRGNGAAAFDGADVIAGSSTMAWGGALRATWPEPNITSTVTVRASAVTAGGVGALMTLWVDGVAVSAAQVNSTAPADYLMPTPALKPGSKVAVTFANPGTVDGVARQLNVAYLIAGSTFLTPSSTGITYSAGNLSGAWPAVNVNSSLTVRAHANLAGDVGAVMQVRVDGVVTDSVEVRATQPTDYRLAIPALKPGSLVDVVYANDGSVNGVDRNLHVQQISTADTAVLPTAAIVTYDKGPGAAAFDGQNVIAGITTVHSDGALRLAWPAPNLTDRLTVRASATPAGGVGAQMIVRVDGVVVGTTEVTATEPTDHVFATPPLAVDSRVDVAFANAATVDGTARSLRVHYLKAGNTVLQPSAGGMSFDAGTGLSAYDGVNAQPTTQSLLTANGALRGRWPAANMTDSLTLRASARLLGNVGPIVKVLVDGVVIGTVELRSTTPADIALPSLPLKPGQRVEVVYTNPADGRELELAYAITGKTVLLATNNTLNAAWPEPNLTDSLLIRARGTPAGGVGPVMQVLVDGILVGSAEVKSTDNADFRFAVPPMTAGRKLDIAFVNDATVAGADRNLYVAYANTANTVWLPSASGNTYDRGDGAAAFDGTDIVAPSGNMVWGGALRATWPQPNITSTVTVRASAVPAGGVGALMTLWVDGVAVSAAQVNSTAPADYLMPTPALKPGSKVAVTFANPGTVDGVARQLNVAYLIAGSTFLTPSSTGTTYSAGNLSGAWPAVNVNSSLTVRAHANLAGDVGAMMSVRVDGVVTDSVEVRATQPTDYRLAIPALKPGSLVDVVYTNDGSVNGVDRNLHVQQISTADTAVLPTAAIVTYDKGPGAAAFDGQNVIAGITTVHSDGALRMAWPAPNLTDRLTVRTSATPAGGVGAQMIARVDGIVVGVSEVSSTEPVDHVFATPPIALNSRVDVALANAATVDGTARSLRVHYLMAGTTVMQPSAGNMFLDAGSGLAAYDGVTFAATSQNLLTANGALRGWWPAPNMTDSLTLRASARLLGNVGPIVKVLVDGVVIGTVELRSTTPADIALPSLPLKPGQRVEVVYTNPADGRALQLAYAITGKTVLLATNNTLNADWPEPNLTDSLLIRARGTPAGGVGPVMQVLVDGILVGSAEVKSTDNADFRFAVPPMTAGRKLDIAYVNDATVDGVDRNLFIAYATTANTVWLPGNAGNTYDRGNGAAAFDGADVIAGSGTMAWGGALRATWPEPNITSTVTVRASAVTAGGVGALMTLWVDGVAVSAAQVNSTAPADYLMPTPALKPGSKVAVTFANPGTVDGVTRQLNVAYLIAGSTFLTPTSAGATYSAGNLAGTWPSANITDTLTVRAYATIAGGVGAVMQLRVDGVIVGSTEVRSSTPVDYRFAVPKLAAGSRIDVVYTNDSSVNGVDRSLFVQYLQINSGTLVSFASGVIFDAGAGEAAVDGVSTSTTSGGLYTNGALRFTVPTFTPAPSTAQHAVSRLLQQASFGPTLADIERVAQIGQAAWIDEQLALPFTPDMVAAMQARYDQGDAYRPGGASYNPSWVGQRFWEAAATSPDQLRRRMGFALHQVFMVSQADSNLYYHARAYAQYVDTLNRHALGNYRDLLEQMALSPAMGIYLSHMRNRPEDAASGRAPDENFAREVMQLFSIGLHELNLDGSPRLNAGGQPIETYSNDDVLALSKVFTGWGWAFPDGELTEQTFRYRSPVLTAAADQRIDILPMKAYPGLHSTSEKRLFSGKAQSVTLPAGNGAQADLKLALDALFNHPNVGPFISRQLIQHLVSSHPSPAYVARVAAVFNNNGKGVRGDLGAMARAILLDSEATNPPASGIGKLREPVARVAHWMRSLQATSATGQYAIVSDLEPLGQRPLYAGSVFGYFRPGYVPPNTVFSAERITVPTMQIVSETTTAQWINQAERMAGSGLGWTGTGPDVSAQLQPLGDLVAAGQLVAVIDRLDLLLYAGRMSGTLRQDLMDAMLSVSGNSAAAHLNRARVAVFLALASPEYMVQR